MALILRDRVKEGTTTTGTGAIALAGAGATFKAFTDYMSNGDTTYYAIAHTASGVNEWEIGLGTWNTGNTLSRTTVLASSNSNNAVNLSSGTKDIFMTYPSNKAVFLDASGNLTVSGDLTVSGTTTTVNSTTTTVDDPVFTIGGDTAPGSDDNKDRGIEFRWHDGSSAKVGFFGFDDSTGKFTFIPDATNSSEVFSGTAGTIVAALEGNASTATTLATARNIAGQSFDGSANISIAPTDLTGVTSTAAELNILDGVTSTAAELNILDGVTSTAAELNILDGVTSTAAELNLVDGSSAGTVVNSKAVVYGSSGEVNATTLQVGGQSITSTPAELNILDGVTATTAELNIMDGVTATTAELNIMDGVTATATELNLMDGVTATTAELNYVDGVTSAIQTQIDTKQPYHTIAVTVVDSGGNKYALDGTVQQTALLQKSVTIRFDQSDSSNANHPLALSTTSDGTHNSGSAFTTGVTTVGTPGSAGAYTQVTLEQDAPDLLYTYCTNHSGMGAKVYSGKDWSTLTSTIAELNILDGVTSTAAELNILDGVTSTAAELNILDGVTATTAELNIMDGVTSTTAELNILDGVTSTAAELNILDGVTSTATELNLLDGVTATTAELNYVDGVTSAIQTQLDAKVALAGSTMTGALRHDQDTVAGGGGTVTIDLSAANNFQVNMTADTTFAFSNKDAGRFGNIIFVQDGSGGHDFTLPSDCKTPVNGASIVQSTGANEVSVLSYYVLNSSTILVNYIGDFA